MESVTAEHVASSEEDVLRVKASSNPQTLAAAIAHAVYANRKVTIRAIGAGSVNQAVKACAIARGYVAPQGLDLYFVPGFTTVKMTDNGNQTEVSAITLRVMCN